MGAKNLPSRESVDKMYKEFKKVPLSKWVQLTPAKLGRQVEFKKLGLDANVHAPMASGLARIAHAYDSETFYEAVTTGTLPPVKLSSAEMQALSGGDAMDDTFRVIGVVGVLVAAAFL